MRVLATTRGFTLIELLVVISIIGLLSSLTLGALSETRAKARDSQRISDLRQIQNALELYHTDNNTYPIYDSANGILSTSAGWNNLASDLANYITLPVDPINDRTTWFTWQSGGDYAYYYKSDTPGASYDLVAWFETNNPLQCSFSNWTDDTQISGWGSAGSSWCPASTTFPYSYIRQSDYIYDAGDTKLN